MTGPIPAGTKTTRLPDPVTSAFLAESFPPDLIAMLAADSLNMGRLTSKHLASAQRRRAWAVARLAGVAVWGAVGWTLVGSGLLS